METKTILITGSSRGLGKQLALVFAEKGYDIILHGRNKDDLERVKKSVLARGVHGVIMRGDLRSKATIDRLARAAVKMESVLLINNAGLASDEVETVILTNLVAPLLLTQRIYPIFLKQDGGTIININSISGLEAQRLRSIYCVSKWGLRGFTEALRLETPAGIQAIGVYPSRIKTRPDYTYGWEPRAVAEKFMIFIARVRAEI